jgi:hypothetical protein
MLKSLSLPQGRDYRLRLSAIHKIPCPLIHAPQTSLTASLSCGNCFGSHSKRGERTWRRGMRKKQRRSTAKMWPFLDFIPDPLPTVFLERFAQGAHQTDEQYPAEWKTSGAGLSCWRFSRQRRWPMAITRRATNPLPPQAPLHWNTFARCERQLSDSTVSSLRDDRHGRAGAREMFSIRKTKHVVLVAADGSLHPGAEMLEDET